MQLPVRSRRDGASYRLLSAQLRLRVRDAVAMVLKDSRRASSISAEAAARRTGPPPPRSPPRGAAWRGEARPGTLISPPA